MYTISPWLHDAAQISLRLQGTFELEKADSDVSTDKVTVLVRGPDGDVPCNIRWSAKIARCTFTTRTTGEHSVMYSSQSSPAYNQ